MQNPVDQGPSDVAERLKAPQEGTSPAPPAGPAADAAAAVSRERAAEFPRLGRELVVNRELSLLGFQWRVLDEARDPANPLLERVRFLAIVASNLDEFFMVRVAGLQQQVSAGVNELSLDGLTPAQQLAEIRREAHRLRHALATCWQDELRPLLDAAGL
ncbi:MAG TPA: RNA degradosome polyphosphate kinase, partial [Anaeromyxobacter sp.]